MQRHPRKLERESIESFLKGFSSEATKESYYKKQGQFLEFHSVTPDDSLQKAIKNPRFAGHSIIDYVEARRKQVSGPTFRQTRDALKHFFEMNDLDNEINWREINKLIPRGTKLGPDRAPAIEEIRSILENSDIRTKCIVLLATSSGFRVGAFDYLKWGDVTISSRFMALESSSRQTREGFEAFGCKGADVDEAQLLQADRRISS